MRQSSEKALVLAIIEQAMTDILVDRCKKESRDAYQWIYHSESTNSFSFLWACELLDINPKVIRAKILEFQANNKKLYYKRATHFDQCRLTEDLDSDKIGYQIWGNNLIQLDNDLQDLEKLTLENSWADRLHSRKK